MKLKYRKKSTKTGKNFRGGGRFSGWPEARIYNPVYICTNKLSRRIYDCLLNENNVLVIEFFSLKCWAALDWLQRGWQSKRGRQWFPPGKHDRHWWLSFQVKVQVNEAAFSPPDNLGSQWCFPGNRRRQRSTPGNWERQLCPPCKQGRQRWLLFLLRESRSCFF